MEKDKTKKEKKDGEITVENTKNPDVIKAREKQGADVPDLFESFTKAALASSDIHGSLLVLFDNFLQNAGITDPKTLGVLARLRAQIDISLKGL